MAYRGTCSTTSSLMATPRAEAGPESGNDISGSTLPSLASREECGNPGTRCAGARRALWDELKRKVLRLEAVDPGEQQRVIFSYSPGKELRRRPFDVSKVVLRQGGGPRALAFGWSALSERQTHQDHRSDECMNSYHCAMRCCLPARSRPAQSGVPRYGRDDLETDRRDR